MTENSQDCRAYFAEPVLIVIVPGSGKRLEFVEGESAERLVTYITSWFYGTDVCRVEHTREWGEYDGVEEAWRP